MVKSVIKIVGVLAITELILFVAMIVTSMTDEKPPAIARIFYWTLKYILGFPLFLINGEYPFFLDSKHMPIYSLILIIINNIILAFIIIGIRKMFLPAPMIDRSSKV